MENYTVLIIIVAIVLAVFGGIAYLIPRLVKKGIDISGILSGTSSALHTADIVLEGVQGIFPDVAGLGVVDRIIDYAQEATAAAEQMYKASKIEATQRKAAATEIIYDCLKVAGIEATDDVKKIVDGCIEAAVYALPKTHDEGK